MLLIWTNKFLWVLSNCESHISIWPKYIYVCMYIYVYIFYPLINKNWKLVLVNGSYNNKMYYFYMLQGLAPSSLYINISSLLDLTTMLRERVLFPFYRWVRWLHTHCPFPSSYSIQNVISYRWVNCNSNSTNSTSMFPHCFKYFSQLQTPYI